MAQTLNVEIETEAAQFPEEEYISGIFLAVYAPPLHPEVHSPNCFFFATFTCTAFSMFGAAICLFFVARALSNPHCRVHTHT